MKINFGPYPPLQVGDWVTSKTDTWRNNRGEISAYRIIRITQNRIIKIQVLGKEFHVDFMDRNLKRVELDNPNIKYQE